MIDFEYPENICGWINLDRLIQIINNPEVKILDYYKGKNEYGIFRIIILESDVVYTFYGNGYHNIKKEYVHDKWYFDIYLNYKSNINNDYIKKSIINSINVETSWFKRRGFRNQNNNIDLDYYQEV